MAHRMFRLALLVSLSSLLTADATAQTQPRSDPPLQGLSGELRILPAPLGAIVVTDPREQSFGLAEDMEIMGQILDDALEGLFERGVFTFSVSDSGGLQRRRSPGKIRAPHAVYLDRYGVVYQLEAPPLHQVPKKVKAEVRATRKPLTVWEKTRRRLRGEKVEDAEATSSYRVAALQPIVTAPTQGQLIRNLFNVLAQNGHNFRHLGPEERLTVAITFRKKTSKSQPKTKAGPAWSSGGFGGGVDTGGLRHLRGMDSWFGGGPVKSNDETTGDLHWRQGDFKKAIEAYEKALRPSFVPGRSFYNRLLIPSGGLSPKNRRLMQKLSQVQIRAGNFDKARQVLDNLNRAGAAAKDASKSKSKTHEQGSLPFSAQLVISVKKADLDAVAAGKIKGDEFKKRATLRYLDPAELRRNESKHPERDDHDLSNTKP